MPDIFPKMCPTCQTTVSASMRNSCREALCPKACEAVETNLDQDDFKTFFGDIETTTTSSVVLEESPPDFWATVPASLTAL